jgi:hypothetical protein
MSHPLPVLGELLILAGTSLAVVMLARRPNLPAEGQGWKERTPMNADPSLRPSGRSAPAGVFLGRARYVARGAARPSPSQLGSPS